VKGSQIEKEFTDRISTCEEIKLACETLPVPGGRLASAPAFLDPVLIFPEVLADLSDDELLFLSGIAGAARGYTH
jgi:hypothetical protein